MDWFLKWIFTHFIPIDKLNIIDGVMVLTMLLLFKIYLKVKGFVDKLEKLEKRHSKMVQVMEQCPSSTKAIVAWLGDDRKNSRPPTPSRCEMPCTKDLINKNKGDDSK